MPDIFTRQGEANPADILMSDRTAAVNSFSYSATLSAASQLAPADDAAIMAALAGAAASGLSLADTVALVASLALAGSGAVTFADTAALVASLGLAGTSGLALSDTAALVASLAASATSGLSFAGSLVAVAALALAGSPAIAQSDTVAMVAALTASGSTGLTFAGALSAAAAILFGAAAALALLPDVVSGGGVQASQSFAAVAALALADTAAMLAALAGAGTAALGLSDTATMQAAAALAPASGLTFAGRLDMQVALAAAAVVAITSSARLDAVAARTMPVAGAVAVADTVDLAAALAAAGVSHLTQSDTAALLAQLGASANASMAIAGALVAIAAAALAGAPLSSFLGNLVVPGSRSETAASGLTLAARLDAAASEPLAGMARGPQVPKAFAQAVLQDAPVTYMRFDEASGAVAADSSGNGRDGTYAGSPTKGVQGLVVGDANRAVRFPGTVNDIATWSGNAALNPGLGSMTWMVAFRTAMTGSSNFFRKDSGGSNNGYLARINQDGPGRVGAVLNNAIAVDSGASPAWNDDKPHLVHVVLNRATDRYQVWVDGVKRGDVSAASQHAVNITTVAVGSLGENFVGPMDEAAVFAGDIGADRIDAHWKAFTADAVVFAAAAESLSPHPALALTNTAAMGAAETAAAAAHMAGLATLIIGVSESFATLALWAGASALFVKFAALAVAVKSAHSFWEHRALAQRALMAKAVEAREYGFDAEPVLARLSQRVAAARAVPSTKFTKLTRPSIGVALAEVGV